MKNLLIVLASQDYFEANHKGLWEEYSKNEGEYVIVVNLPADYLVSRLKHKQYRRCFKADGHEDGYGKYSWISKR